MGQPCSYGDHRVADDEARTPSWRDVPAERLPPGEQVVVRRPAGSGIFFSAKILHAAPHNPRSRCCRSGRDQASCLRLRSAQRITESGPGANSQRMGTMRPTFPHLFPGGGGGGGGAGRGDMRGGAGWVGWGASHQDWHDTTASVFFVLRPQLIGTENGLDKRMHLTDHAFGRCACHRLISWRSNSASQRRRRH